MPSETFTAPSSDTSAASRQSIAGAFCTNRYCRMRTASVTVRSPSASTSPRMKQAAHAGDPANAATVTTAASATRRETGLFVRSFIVPSGSAGVGSRLCIRCRFRGARATKNHSATRPLLREECADHSLMGLRRRSFAQRVVEHGARAPRSPALQRALPRGACQRGFTARVSRVQNTASRTAVRLSYTVGYAVCRPFASTGWPRLCSGCGRTSESSGSGPPQGSCSRARRRDVLSTTVEGEQREVS